MGKSITDSIVRSGLAIDLFTDDPETTSWASKVVNAHKAQRGQKIPGRDIETPGRQDLESIADETANNITDAQSVEAMLPDIELAKQVLVSSIISPQDMTSAEVNFIITNPTLPPEITTMQRIMDEFFTNEYKIGTLLEKALEDALFNTGAYPLMVVPENALDSAINHGGRLNLESVSGFLTSDHTSVAPIGILGPGKEDPATAASSTLSFESLFVSPEQARPVSAMKVLGMESLLITDNPNILKFPGIFDKKSQEMLERAYARAGMMERAEFASMESSSVVQELSKLSVPEQEKIKRSLYRDRPLGGGVAMSLAPAERYSRRPVGHPLVMKLPVESIIPVHVPGTPEQHVGYFILLDEFGNPLYRARGSDYYRQLEGRLSSVGPNGATHGLTDITYKQMFGLGSSGGTDRSTQAKFNAYATIVEEEFMTRLFNGGVYRGGLEIQKQNEFYRIMLSRQLANKSTQILYAPKELVTYFAFEYNEHGVGRSLIDKSKILSTMRSVVMFANTMASVRKATPAVTLNLEIDAEDQNPGLQVEQALHEYSRTKATAYPLATNQPGKLLDYLQNANISVAVSGNPRYPDTKITQEERNQANVTADTELEEALRKKHHQSFGLSPEVYDSSNQIEFAQSIISGSLLMAKRVMMYQGVAVPLVNDHMHKYVRNSGKLYKQLVMEATNIYNGMDDKVKAALTDSWTQLGIYFPSDDETENKRNMISLLVETVIDAYSIQLPQPDVSKFEQQMAAFDAYSNALDKALRAYVTPEMIQGAVSGATADTVESYFVALKGYFLRNWLKKNNVLAELEVLGDTEEGATAGVIDEAMKHVESVQGLLEGFSQVLQRSNRGFERKVADETQKEEEKYGTGGQDDDLSGGDGATTGDGDAWGDDSNDAAGVDEFNLDETSTPETPTETAEPEVQNETATPETPESVGDENPEKTDEEVTEEPKKEDE